LGTAAYVTMHIIKWWLLKWFLLDFLEEGGGGEAQIWEGTAA